MENKIIEFISKVNDLQKTSRYVDYPKFSEKYSGPYFQSNFNSGLFI